MAKFKSNARGRECPICRKPGHTPAKCFLLEKVLKIWKQIKGDAATNFVEKVAEDPFHEEVMPVREAILSDIDWSQAEIDEGDIDEIITAALECPLLYLREESDSE